jgi:chromosome segregation ATPase
MDWQPASLFIAEAETAATEPACQWVWLYRAPWAWLAEGDSADAVAALQQWLAQQRAVLQLRRHLRHHLILVNVDRIAAQPLAERLGLPCYDEQSAVIAGTPLTLTLASLFEQAGPEYWTLYEALEAAAWLPEGEPEFRSNRVFAPNEGLGELLELIHAGRQFPTASQQLDERNKALQCVREELKSTQALADSAQREASIQLAEREQAITRLRQEMEKARSAEQSLEEESELLLAQLHEVQKELKQHSLDIASYKQQHASLKQELAQATDDQQQLAKDLDIARETAATAEQAREKMAEDEADLRKETADIRTGSQSLSEENELLLAQLHQVQEELEKYFLDNVSFKQQHATLNQKLAQANTDQQQLSKDLDIARAVAAKAEQTRGKLAEDEAGLQKETADIRASLQSLTEENELLLAQLHEVQEELEKYSLANREILATMGQSEDTLHRARNVISRMVAHA